MAFPGTGSKGFKSHADIEAYITAFNADDFENYFCYYHPDVCIDIAAIPGGKTLSHYHAWAVGHHQIATETLVPQKIVLDHERNLAVLDSLTEFRGRKGHDRADFFGWGPLGEGSGPVVRMVVFYHLDAQGRIVHLEPAGATLVKRADGAHSATATKKEEKKEEEGAGLRTEDDVRAYLKLFSSNRFQEASAFWAPDLQVTLGPTVIEGRDANIKFFEAQREGNVNENVEPTVITLDAGSCALRAVVTFTTLKDFPEGYFGMGAKEGLRTGQKIRNDYVIFYDLDGQRKAKSIKAYPLGIPVIS